MEGMYMDDVQRLGGNIELSGFKILNGGEMIIAKKIIGNYARKMEGMCQNFSGLKLRVKPLHHTEEKFKKFELHGQVVDGGHVYPASEVEHNIFVAIDAICKKLVHEVEHKKQ
jgi:hypothetical protein